MKASAKYIILVLIFIAPRLFSQNEDNISIAMLNHLTTEVRLIINSSDSRLVLEDVYNRIVNGIDIDAIVVDDYTQQYLRDMRMDLQRLRLVTLQRDRLQIILEKKQSQAISKSMPNPLYVFGAINFSDLTGGPQRIAMKLIANTGAMALDSVAKYKNEMNESNMEFLTENWKLDDLESESLYSLRDNTFDHMIDLVKANRVKGYETLNEDSIDGFIDNKYQTNPRRKLEFLESNQAKETYALYAPYWLELATVYYERASENNDNLEEYKKSLDALGKYETVQAKIFRKDYAYGAILPKMILAASYVYENDRVAYVRFAEDHLKKLIENSDEKHCTLRFFAAQTHLSLAVGARKEFHLRAAYDILMDNIRLLSIEHEKTLDEYYSPVAAIPESLTDSLAEAKKEVSNAKLTKDDQKKGEGKRIADAEVKKAEKKVKSIEKQIKDYREYRKKELPPFSDSLWLNFTTALSVMKELNLQEGSRLREIIGEAFFQLDWMEFYWELTKEDDYDGTFSFENFKFLGDNYYMMCPDVVLTEVNSIDMSLYEDDSEKALWREYDVKWNILSINKKNFENPKLSHVKMELLTKSRFKLDKNTTYRLEIFIKNIDEEGSYNNRLYFENPAGQNKWKFQYVE